MPVVTKPTELPVLLDRAEVLSLTRQSAQALNRAVRQGALPAPNEIGLWARDALLAALGLVPSTIPHGPKIEMKYGSWPTDPRAIRGVYLSIFPHLQHYQMHTFQQTQALDEIDEPARTGAVTDISTTHSPCLDLGEGVFTPDPSFLPSADEPMTFVTLTRLVLRSLKIDSIKSVLSHLRKAFAWSASLGHPDFRLLTPTEIDCFLDHTFSSVSVRFGVKSALRRLFNEAIAHGWLKENPVDGTKRRRHSKPPITLWFQEDLDQYIDVAVEMGDTAYAAFLIVQFELGQRITDLLRVNDKSVFFDGFHFVFWQQKTGEFSDLPISDQARARIRSLQLDLKKPLFRNWRTDKVFTNEVLAEHHILIAQKVVSRGGRRLKLAKLRHSCVAELANAGCSVLEIASVTGHTPATVTRILDFYFKGRSHLALKAQSKRGFTYYEAGTDPLVSRLVEQHVQVRSAWSIVDGDLAGRMPSVRRMAVADYLRRNSLFKGDYRLLGEVLDAAPIGPGQPYQVDFGPPDATPRHEPTLTHVPPSAAIEDGVPAFLLHVHARGPRRRRQRSSSAPVQIRECARSRS